MHLLGDVGQVEVGARRRAPAGPRCPGRRPRAASAAAVARRVARLSARTCSTRSSSSWPSWRTSVSPSRLPEPADVGAQAPTRHARRASSAGPSRQLRVTAAHRLAATIAVARPSADAAHARRTRLRGLARTGLAVRLVGGVTARGCRRATYAGSNPRPPRGSGAAVLFQPPREPAVSLTGILDALLDDPPATRHCVAGGRGRPLRRPHRPRPHRAARASARSCSPALAAPGRPAGARGHRHRPRGRGPGRRAALPAARRTRSSSSRPGRRCRTSGSRPRATPSAAGSPCCAGSPTPSADDPATGPLRVVVAPVRAVLQPQVAGLGDLEPVALRAGDERRPRRRSSRRLAAAALHPRRPGREARRVRRARRHPRRLPADRGAPAAGRVLGRRRSRRSATSRSPTSARLEVAEHGLWAPPCRELLLTDDGARAGRARWPPSTPSWPTCSTSSPRASRSRAWSRSRRCSSTTWSCCSTSCRPAPTCVVCDPERVRTRAHDLVAHQRRSSSRRPGRRGRRRRQGPVDLGAAALPQRSPTSASTRPRAGHAVVDASSPFARRRGRSRPTDDVGASSAPRAAEAYRGDTARALADVKGWLARRLAGGAASPRGTARPSALVEVLARRGPRRPGSTPTLDRRPSPASCTSSLRPASSRGFVERRPAARACSPRPT